jgi:hypothetical protein
MYVSKSWKDELFDLVRASLRAVRSVCRFYVHDVSLLEDEVTRYHYFLQLKLDVTEGRLRCNFEQAIVLASYSLQAEYGDHDPEKHTFEYLQEFPLLPKPMMQQFPEDKIRKHLNPHNGCSVFISNLQSLLKPRSAYYHRLSTSNSRAHVQNRIIEFSC